MRLCFIYKILPSLVIYTDRFIGDKFSGKAFGNIILIRPSQKDNECLLKHELMHVKQFYVTFGLHGLLYKLSDIYKLKCEIEAYKATIECSGYTSRSQSLWIVETLYNDYGLNVTKDEIIKLLYSKEAQ